MKRFNILLGQVLVGSLAVYQFFPFGQNYTIGLIHTLYFVSLAVVYLGLFLYENFLNKEAVRYEQKKFDRSSQWLTLLFIVVLLVFKNSEYFEASTRLMATAKYNYKLELKVNNKFHLQKSPAYETYHWKGSYRLEADTLHLFGNSILEKSSSIDSLYVVTKDSLIPVSWSREAFRIVSTADEKERGNSQNN
jgi:hypothetical protein